MLRSSLVRAAGSVSCSNLPTTTLRHSLRSPQTISVGVTNGFQTRQAHAISNPTLADIERRWEAMPPQEQADLWMALRDRMKVDWKDLTIQEKKAAYWIAFGPHGPRAQAPPGEGTRVFMYTMVGVGVSAVIFGTARYFARDPPKTMTKEYQEKMNEYLQGQNVEPISGVSSEGFKGGYGTLVQSKSGNNK